MVDDHDHEPLTALERIAAFCTLSDPAILVQCHAAERQRVVHEFFMLCAMALLFTAIWFTVMAMFGIARYVALPIALLIVAIVLFFDVRMTATDTHPRGILRTGPYPHSFFWRLASRLAISLLLNLGTAVGVDLYIMHDEALKAEMQDTDAKNAPTRNEYDQKVKELRQQEVAPLETRIGDLTGQLDTIARNLVTAQQAWSDAFKIFQAQALEMHRQDGGFGDRLVGHGKLAKDAQEQSEQAHARMQAAEARKTELDSEQRAAQAQLAIARTDFAAARARYDRDKVALLRDRDAQLLRATDGPMTVVLGWLKLQSNPEIATAVHLTTVIAFLTVMTLELAFFLCRVPFKGEQMHDVRLRDRMRREVVALGAAFAREVREARQRSPLRVVAEGGVPRDNPEGPEQH